EVLLSFTPMIADEQLNELIAWIADAGLAGQPELALLTGFCERAVTAGLPLTRAHLLIDTLDPVHEGRVFRWGFDASLPAEEDYGRTSWAAGAATSGSPLAPTAPHVDAWRGSPFYRMRETGESLLRRRLPAADETEFKVLPEMRAAGFTDYVAIINRFAAEGSIGEMDCVYSSWVPKDPGRFRNEHIAALQRLAPFLALAVKSVALTRMTGTLMQTYLGRDAGRRVLSGRIMRGVADRIDTVLWFSDLRGFTRISDMTPKHVIPLLNDYADVIVSAIHEQDGDVLKFTGDGVLAIFTADDRTRACNAALAAAMAARRGVAELNQRRARQPDFRSPTCISACASARGSMATSGVGSGSISRWWDRPSTKSAGSRRCAARPSSRCWCPLHLPKLETTEPASFPSGATLCAVSAAPRSCLHSTQAKAAAAS